MGIFKHLLVFLALALPVQAEEKAVQSVISEQISAFLVDDFETAFSYASPSIRGIFQTPERFGQMVARGYPMVHRPEDFQFQDSTLSDSGVIQDVLIRDAQGEYYVARYSLVETDKGWKINAVEVLKAPGVGA